MAHTRMLEKWKKRETSRKNKLTQEEFSKEKGNLEATSSKLCLNWHEEEKDEHDKLFTWANFVNSQNAVPWLFFMFSVW